MRYHFFLTGENYYVDGGDSRFLKLGVCPVIDIPVQRYNKGEQPPGGVDETSGSQSQGRRDSQGQRRRKHGRVVPGWKNGACVSLSNSSAGERCRPATKPRRGGILRCASFRGGDTSTWRIAMNTDQFKGKWVQFKGEVKKQWGKFTDDDLKQIEGDYDKFVGRIQERYGDKKEEVIRWADDWYGRQGQAQPGTQRREAQPPR